MSADLLASLYEKPKESGLHESYAATSGTIAKLLNRPQVKAQGTLGDKHWDRTRMELHMEPPAPDLGKVRAPLPCGSALLRTW